MAESQKALVTQIKADKKIFYGNQKAMEKVHKQLQCKCVHRDADGAFAIFVADAGKANKSPFTGAPLYRCSICNKEIDISNISNEEFRSAIATLDRLCDLIKMHLNLKSEKDQEMWKTIKKFQFKLTDIIPDAYAAISREKRGKKKKTSPMQGYIEVWR